MDFDPYSFLDAENRELLAEIRSQIDPVIDQQFKLPARKLGPSDHSDIHKMAQNGFEMDQLFKYFSRPKEEVIEYLLANMPQDLNGLLTNTRKQREGEF